MARVRVKTAEPEQEAEEQLYAPVPKITSGSYLLDKVLGGGWAEGRVSNVVGDRSAGKTLLAIEAMANFANTYGADNSRYIEAESAFDHAYAQSIGMPEGVNFTDDVETVEQLDKDMGEWIGQQTKKKTKGGIYVVDSLDALSDTAEMERDADKGSYQTQKAKFMSTMFRKRIAGLAEANIHMMVISQIRDKIGVTFGETKTRSGGRALDFYSSQIIWLADIGKLKRTVKGKEIIYGSNVQIRCRKNKVGTPHREVAVEVHYNYGIDDEVSMINYLKAHKDADIGEGKTIEGYKIELRDIRRAQDYASLRKLNKRLRKFVGAHWDSVEDAIRPTMRKYNNDRSS